MRIAMISLAVVQVIIAGFGALIGSFADGGEWFDRAVLLFHPIAAISLLAIVAMPRLSRFLIRPVLALLLINIIADASLSLMIGLGFTRGDWWLPLVFSVIPAIAIIYLQRSLRHNS